MGGGPTSACRRCAWLDVCSGGYSGFEGLYPMVRPCKSYMVERDPEAVRRRDERYRSLTGRELR